MTVSAWLPLFSGLIGALIGASANAYLRSRADRQTARENLVGEIALFSRDSLATLLELFQATRPEASSSTLWGVLADAERLMGRGAALEVRVFREFRSRKIRAAFHQLLNRIDSVKEELGATMTDEARLRLGCAWVNQQAQVAVELASGAAGIGLRDRSRLVFVGFRKVTPADRRALSFDPEPLPWRYALTLDFTDRLPSEAYETILRRSDDRVGAMLCEEHGYAPQIRLVGPSSDFRIEIQACCEPFVQEVHRRFLGLDQG